MLICIVWHMLARAHMGERGREIEGDRDREMWGGKGGEEAVFFQAKGDVTSVGNRTAPFGVSISSPTISPNNNVISFRMAHGFALLGFSFARTRQ